MNIMFKTTNGCNANCSYCFDKFAQTARYSVMAPERVVEIFDKLTDADKNITWVWHGGEPLLAGYDWFEKCLFGMAILAIQKEVNFKVDLQTNGILLDDKFMQLFDKYNVTVSMSHDGYNNILSRGYPDPPTLKSTLYGITIVNPYNIDHLIDDYKKRCAEGYQEFHTNLMFPPRGQSMQDVWGLPPQAIVDKYLEYILFYLYYKQGTVSDGSVDDWICCALGKSTNYCTFGNCFETDLLCIDTKGDIYKCDALYPEVRLGNIDDFDDPRDILKSPIIQKHIELKELQKQKYCKDCPWVDNCFQGCWTRSLEESNGERPFELHCIMTKTIVPELFNRLYNLTPEDMFELNPVVRYLLISKCYVPYYMKQERGLI